METKHLILKYTAPLIGLKWAIARRAADMRVLHFGQITTGEKRTPQGSTRQVSQGEFALHIQCPWRIESLDGIVTGRTDLFEPAEADAEVDWDTWDYEKEENLQDCQIGKLLGGYDNETRSFVNQTERFVVEEVLADQFGGIIIALSGNYRVVLFSSGSRGEDWRLFQPNNLDSHFVICGGQVEEIPGGL